MFNQNFISFWFLNLCLIEILYFMAFIQIILLKNLNQFFNVKLIFIELFTFNQFFIKEFHFITFVLIKINNYFIFEDIS